MIATEPRVALVHDFLLDVRGAERVFLELCAMWPEADIYTAVYDEDGTEGRFAGRRIHTSFLQRLRPSARTFRALLPLYPPAIEAFDMSGYDLVLSSSSAWAHAVVCDGDTLHVSYCHNPFRYAWNDRERTLARTRNPVTRELLRSVFHRWRQWDWIAAQRTDRYIANSRTTQSRIRAYYGREAPIVYPPVETGRFTLGTASHYYLLVSELVGHKQIDVAIEAFNRVRLPLVIVGDGPEARALRRRAGPKIVFTGRLPDPEVAELMRGARALIMTAIEEFGIAAVECQAAGRPVIARRGGGALETVVDGVTGHFFAGDPNDLVRAVVEFDDQAIDPAACARNAARFDAAGFRAGIEEQIAAAAEAGTGRNGDSQPLMMTRLVRRAVENARH
jgi:glycosyltransferase involved in cell wall biosynthesis